MKLVVKIREFLWSIGLYNKCPICGGEFIIRGFEGHNRRYICKKCNWVGLDCF